MKNARYLSWAGALMILLISAPLEAERLSATERQQLLKHLAESRQMLLDAVKGVSNEQWKFKPAERSLVDRRVRGAHRSGGGIPAR